jgi:hypothetical protein
MEAFHSIGRTATDTSRAVERVERITTTTVIGVRSEEGRRELRLVAYAL